jgi:hypothetical protein
MQEVLIEVSCGITIFGKTSGSGNARRKFVYFLSRLLCSGGCQFLAIIKAGT